MAAPKYPWTDPSEAFEPDPFRGNPFEGPGSDRFSDLGLHPSRPGFGRGGPDDPSTGFPATPTAETGPPSVRLPWASPDRAERGALDLRRNRDAVYPWDPGYDFGPQPKKPGGSGGGISPTVTPEDGPSSSVHITRGESGGPALPAEGRHGRIHRVMPNEWRTRLLLDASWRSIEFEIEQFSRPVGRRAIVHEYPQRDEVFVEDAGRATRVHRITGYVIGDDYDLRRKRLVDALEEPGDGELIHPYLGKLRCRVIEPCSLSEQVQEQRIAKFELTFVEVEELPVPLVEDDDGGSAYTGAARLRFKASGKWADADESLFSRVTTAAAKAYVDFKDSTSKGLALALGVAIDLVDLPADFSAIIADIFDAARLLAAIVYVPQVPTLLSSVEVTPARLFSTWVKTELFTRCVEIVLSTDFETQDDAVFQATSVAEAIHVEEAATDDPEVYQDLVNLRLPFLKAMLDLGRRLPRVRTFHVDGVVPAHVLSYALYETPDRADEIVRRNAVENPNFVYGDIQVASR